MKVVATPSSPHDSRAPGGGRIFDTATNAGRADLLVGLNLITSQRSETGGNTAPNNVSLPFAAIGAAQRRPTLVVV
jgi:hypothetical protein